ncbi:MAG: family 10 glycosylhydrolase [Lentisphaerae bacterium]|nr:family 10 glycosylhydrolase [Lentisphaerota bacterium]
MNATYFEIRKILLLAILSCIGILEGFSAEAPRVVSVVHGQVSLVSQRDAQYAFSRARSVYRTLDEAGITSVLYPDTELQKALAPPCKLAHLVYFEKPSGEQMKLIEKFVSSGGKVIAHYSLSAEFAGLMGVTAPEPLDNADGWWQGFQFATRRPLHCPDFIQAETSRVCHVKPLTKEASVLASWVDASGKSGPAAVLKSKNGYWICRIMLDTGDADARRRFLASISADCVLEVWRHAAKRLDREIWSIVGAETFDGAKKLMLRRAPASRKDELEKRLARLDELESARQADFSKGLFGASMAKLWQMRKEVLLAYAVSSDIGKASRGVFAVWLRSANGVFPGDWEKTASVLSDTGITDVYMMVTDVGIGSTSGSPDAKVNAVREADSIRKAVAACRAKGIRVHAWIYALSLENISQAAQSALAGEGRALCNLKGDALAWADPGHKKNRKELARSLIWFAKNFGVDGIHLDYVRYPHEENFVNSKARSDFEKSSGCRVDSWPADIRSRGKHRQAYEKWRAARLDGLVGYVSGELKKEIPETVFSIATYGKYPLCVETVGQDWKLWSKNKWVHYTVPMNYSANVAGVQKLLHEQIGIADRKRLVCGIGVSSYEATLNSRETIEQIKAALKFNIGGVALYHFDTRFVDEISPALELAKKGRSK